MLFELLKTDLATDNSDANNPNHIISHGIVQNNTTKQNAIITKIPSMSEINYINYINATRLGMSDKARLLSISSKSTIFAGLPGALGANDAAFLISSKDDLVDPNVPSLYEILDRYYQMCKT